jgi:hypothetical protein
MNTSLTVLIEGDAKACQYFNALPAPVRAQLNGQPEEFGGFDDLKTRAERILRDFPA